MMPVVIGCANGWASLAKSFTTPAIRHCADRFLLPGHWIVRRLAAASVTDGRLSTFVTAPVRRMSSQTSNPRIQFISVGLKSKTVFQGVFIGDYTAAAMGADGVLHGSWTDFRGNPRVPAPNRDPQPPQRSNLAGAGPQIPSSAS